MSLFSCHDAKEIAPNLILGGRDNLEELLDMGAELLICLAGAPTLPKDCAWQGELLLRYIEDGDVLSSEELNSLVEEILGLLNRGKRVGMLCIGGHGRTGYVAACVLHRLGVQNPIAYLRKNYCIKAVETERQVRAIREYISCFD